MKCLSLDVCGLTLSDTVWLCANRMSPRERENIAFWGICELGGLSNQIFLQRVWWLWDKSSQVPVPQLRTCYLQMDLLVWESPCTAGPAALGRVQQWSVRNRWFVPSRPSLLSLSGRCLWVCPAKPSVWPSAAPSLPSVWTLSLRWKQKTLVQRARYDECGIMWCVV